MGKTFHRLLLTTIILGGTLLSGTISVNAAAVSRGSIGGEAILSSFENLVKNGDFSAGLTNWQVGTYNTGTVTVKQEGTHNYAELAHPTAKSVAAIAQDMPATQLKKYKLSFMYQGTPHGQLELEANSSTSNQHQMVGLFDLTASSATWRQFNQEIVMPANSTRGNWHSLTTLFVAGNSEYATNPPLKISDVQLVEVN